MSKEIVEIKLTKGQVAIINVDDLPLVSSCKWQAKERRDKNGYYATSRIGSMHRVIMGVTDRATIVDHKDGNGLNNTRQNLRAGVQSQNCVNRKTTPGKNLRGTFKSLNKWCAYLKYKGSQKYLGTFDTEEEAHQAYLNAAGELHGDWIYSNPQKQY